MWLIFQKLVDEGCCHKCLELSGAVSSWLPNAVSWLKQKPFFFPDVADMDICSSASATCFKPSQINMSLPLQSLRQIYVWRHLYGSGQNSHVKRIVRVLHMENNQRSAKCLMQNDVCHWQSSQLQEVFSEPDCAVFHLATCFMCLEWKCIKSHSLQEIKGHVIPHSWMFQSQSNLIQCLDLFQWALNSPLMDMAEPSLQKGQLLWEYWSTRSVHVSIVPLYDVVDPLGCFWQCSSFWEKPGSLPCLVCPRRSLETRRRVYLLSHWQSLVLPCPSPEMQLGPKQTFSGRFKSTAEAKQRI